MTPSRDSSVGRLVGWSYGLPPAALVLSGFLGRAGSSGRDLLFGGVLMLYLSGGFLLARYLHQDSPVFGLFFRFGKLQTSGGSLRDRCLMNFFILAIPGIVLVVSALAGP